MPSTTTIKNPSKRQILGDVTSQVQNQKASKGSGQPQIQDLLIEPENKRISAISNEEKKGSKRDSQASATSAGSATLTARERKRHIGPWQLGSTLGHGSTGRVRKARHTVTGQIAAVKIMSKKDAAELRSQSVMAMDYKLAAKPLIADRKALPFGIEREVVIMKLIEHPNIIKLYDLWENRGELYLVLEYVEGGELFKYIVQNECLGEMEAVRIFRQILSAVAYCHNFELCHRDIKPENILLDSLLNVKLADFGMASREHVGGLLTSCGSPHYAPPEIALGHPYVGAQVDVWSCGVVLYVMMVGSLPFGGNHSGKDIRLVLEQIVTAVPAFPRHMSDEAVDLISRMLEKDPYARITSEEIWRHPLLQFYEAYAHMPEYAARWIGGPPSQLTVEDCGEPLTRDDIDPDLLGSLCTLWHTNNPEEMISALTHVRPNYEKVIYRNLFKFRTEQEENFQGANFELSGSDYHHACRRPLLRAATRASLLGAGQKRSPSQFSIAVPGPRRASGVSIAHPGTRRVSQKSHGGASVSTDKSYDPFRASNRQLPAPEADHAKITVLKGSSVNSRNGRSSNVPSLRHPAVARLQREYTASLPSSPPSFARDHQGRIRSLRKSVLTRQDTSSSWASTRMSSSSSKQFHAAGASTRRRGVVFQHHRRHSSVQQSPPPRPRNPTPLTVQERYARDGVETSDESQGAMETPSPAPLSILQSLPPPLRPRKKAGTNADPKNRTSLLWEERTRQVSIELSNLCDEVFQGSLPGSDFWDAEVEGENQRTFARKSIDLPSLRSTGFDHTEPSLSEFPLPPTHAPLKDMYATDTYRELARVKERLQKGASALGSDELGGLIDHIDRLMADTARKSAGSLESGSRRITSAPEDRYRDFASLSPVKEEEEHLGCGAREGSSRHVSSPVRGKHGYEPSSQRPFGKSTVRLVDSNGSINDGALTDYDYSLFPRPLTIRKKASEPVLGSPRADHKRAISDEPLATERRSKQPQASTLTLDRFFGRDKQVPASTAAAAAAAAATESTTFDTIFAEPGKRASEQRHSRASSGEGKARNWFRRSAGSTRSGGSDRLSEPASNDDGPQPESRSNGTSNSTSDDIPMRQPPPKESAAAKFFKLFKKDPKEKRMQIAMTTDDPDDFCGSSTASTNQGSGTYTHGARANESSTTVTTQNTHARHGSTTRHAHFAPLPPSAPPQSRGSQVNSNKPTSSPLPPLSFPRATNLLARLLQARPGRRVLALSVPREQAVGAIRAVFKDWRRYGVQVVRADTAVAAGAERGPETTVDTSATTTTAAATAAAAAAAAAAVAAAAGGGATGWAGLGRGRVCATVSADNALGIRPVALAADVFPVAVRGARSAQGLAVARVAQLSGARSSFDRAADALQGILRGRDLLVADKGWARDMRRALRDWEREHERAAAATAGRG